MDDNSFPSLIDLQFCSYRPLVAPEPLESEFPPRTAHSSLTNGERGGRFIRLRKFRESDAAREHSIIYDRPQTPSVQVFEIPGVIHALSQDHSTKALGDYCAKYNFINAEYAEQLGMRVDTTRRADVTIGSGKKIRTSGTITSSFRFQNELDTYELIFHVLPKCMHRVILGKPFLKATRTLSSITNFVHRVQKRVLQGMNRQHLFFLGDSAPTFSGLLNGRMTDALADSGSSVLVMDEDYARSLGLHIQTGDHYKTRLRFADGSTATTTGMTNQVLWQFGFSSETDKHFLDFHVLKNAPAKVILSDSFLFSTEAYSRYECYLMDEDDDEEYLESDAFFFTISHDPSYQNKGSIDMSSIANMTYVEQNRRNREEDEIAILPQHDQPAAWIEVLERRRKWDQNIETLRRTLQQNVIPNDATSQPLSSASSGSTPHLSLQGFTKRIRTRLRLSSRVSRP